MIASEYAGRYPDFGGGEIYWLMETRVRVAEVARATMARGRCSDGGGLALADGIGRDL